MATSSSHKRVLVVDDEALVAESLVKVLRSADYEADSSASAEDAERKLKEGGFDLILLDIGLPGMSGFEALDRVAAPAGLPVILISGRVDDELRQDAVLLGAAELLGKPVESALLIETIRKTLAKSPP